MSPEDRQRIIGLPSRLLLAAVGTLLLVAPGRAQEQIEATVGTVGTVANDGPLPAGGQPLIAQNNIEGLRLEGRAAKQATLETVDVAGQPFAKALRVRTPSKTGDDAIVLLADTTGPVKGGDTYFIRFHARTVETGDAAAKGQSTIVVAVNQKGVLNSSAFFGGSARFGPEWRRFDLPVRMWQRYPEAQFSLRLGGQAARVVEVGGVEVYNYGQRVLPHQLPFKRTSYEGRDPQAPWRKEAQARIEQHRKGDLSVRVVDAQNKPVAGATIKVAMQRHAYGFGTAVNPTLLASGPTGDQYRAQVKKLFNEAVVENNLKWRGWESPKGRQDALKMLAWLKENNFKVRGHVVVWPGWRNLPDSLKKLYEDTKAKDGEAAAKAALRTRIDEHITDIVTATKGYLVDWDVVNETVGNVDLLNIFGRDVMASWYKRVREIDPNVTLYLNENSVESGRKADPFERDIRLIRDNGGPINGVGLQGHMGAIPIATVAANLERFSKLNMDIKITEFDMVTPDEQLQADYTRDFLTLVFSYPATKGFLMWGFWDGAQWLHDAPIFYKDWTEKPSGKAYTDLVFKQWWTSDEGQSDAQGRYQTRGFLGDYEVSVTTTAGQTKTIKTTLPKEGRVLTIPVG